MLSINLKISRQVKSSGIVVMLLPMILSLNFMKFLIMVKMNIADLIQNLIAGDLIIKAKYFVATVHKLKYVS